ncbi:MAG: hypothetical protein MJ231_06565 [bacterium]|nr:hypothetical protein [bacterium]
MLVEFWMTMRLTREIHELEKELILRQTELSHYQKYASRLGSSSIMTMNNIAGLSPEILPRATMFAQYSDQASSMSAMQNMQYMQMMGRIPMVTDPIAQQQINMSAYAQFKEESLKALKQQEANVISEKEKEIELEVTDIQQRLSMARAQLDSYKEKARKDAEKWAPQF